MGSRPRVLLADDHPGFVRALTRILSFDCDVVGVVADGGSVAEAAARLQPVIAVVDLHLPNINGLEVCRRIRQTNPLAKVILITAMFDEALKDEGAAAGAIGFFPKLTAATELGEAIRRAWFDDQPD